MFLCCWENKRTEVGDGSKVVCFVSVTKAFNGLNRVIVRSFELESGGVDNACPEWSFGVFDIANRKMSNASFPFQRIVSECPARMKETPKKAESSTTLVFESSSAANDPKFNPPNYF